MNRVLKKEIKIGNVLIGANHKIAIQSMTNTKTKDVASTLNQIISLINAGCDIVRVAVLDLDDAKAISLIKQTLKENGYDAPIVADIHFDYKLALAAIEAGADKIRINPGNIDSEEHLKMIADACKEKHIPIRIGVNGGSLPTKYVNEFGRNSKAMVKTMKEYVELFESFGFYDLVLSLKSSDVISTIEAYNLASSVFSYPLHIGITEAGTFTRGTVLASVGLGVLLHQGIGDTLRVSLTAEPVEEVKVAKEILSSLNLIDKPILVSCPTCGRTQYDMIPLAYEIEKFLETLGDVKIKVAIMGCPVNGVGEAGDADIGVAGGKGEALLFKKGKVIRKIGEDDIAEVLKKEILEMIKK